MAPLNGNTISLVLRIRFIYWEFTLVLDDCGVKEALLRSREHFHNRIPETTSTIFSILAMNVIFGLLVNGFWHPLALIAFIFLYSYIATGMQLALMITLHSIQRQQG